ncbi:biotin--[acetyl-CoA-carboxylase] ligase [Clostridium sp. Marseille-P299]|uniref:biotin--[acetyl-CoA-carboxylase] ligase n=1 Tax=Clostridium sp. Marseille-P299 TaxID=1805477 RepID=UPI00082983C8|nr:biotin--[acetyl-CoA-carboxylase] ligase [Clostridium sp. Marseille-P299]
MSVKKDVLKYLEQNRGEFISGAELASTLDVSRTAIWKSIKSLEADGHMILATTNKGYCLSEGNDILSEEGIRLNLKKEYKEIPIQIDKITTSTNQVAKLAAVNGVRHGSVFIADKQTMGKGRLGRSFLSLDGSGIYMSVVLKPNTSASDAIYITTAASVAVFRAIKKITNKEVKIKWVNDLYYEDKKVCGILTEAVTDLETGMINSIILGIGINYNVDHSKVPMELQEVAGALYHGTTENTTRNQLIAEILNQVFELCMNAKDRSFIREYKEHSMILGSNIWIISGNQKEKAKAIDIDDNGGLIVELMDHSKKTLNSGEVSIRKREE